MLLLGSFLLTPKIYSPGPAPDLIPIDLLSRDEKLIGLIRSLMDYNKHNFDGCFAAADVLPREFCAHAAPLQRLTVRCAAVEWTC